MILIFDVVAVDDIDPVILWRRPLTIPQAAREIGVPERTFRRWVTQGVVISRRLGGRWEVPRPVVARLKDIALGMEVV